MVSGSSEQRKDSAPFLSTPKTLEEEQKREPGEAMDQLADAVQAPDAGEQQQQARRTP